MLLHKAVVAEAAHPSVFVSEAAFQQLRPGNFPKKLVPSVKKETCPRQPRARQDYGALLYAILAPQA
jgi:hypothetical protein